MLTILVSCTHVGCYATEGLGWGGIVFPYFLLQCGKIGKGVTSTVRPALSLLVLQFQWRRSIGSVSSAKFLQELSRVFAERGRN